jgi:hypothetical protein
MFGFSGTGKRIAQAGECGTERLEIERKTRRPGDPIRGGKAS